MAKLTTISITVQQREELRVLAELAGGVTTQELVGQLLRHERRRRMGAMLATTNQTMSGEDRAIEGAIVNTGRRAVSDALR